MPLGEVELRDDEAQRERQEPNTYSVSPSETCQVL